jgi:hypothetical protein
MPFAIPPPVSPVGLGMLVKKSRLIELNPILAIWMKIIARGMRTATVAENIKKVITRFFAERMFTCFTGFSPLLLFRG